MTPEQKARYETRAKEEKRRERENGVTQARSAGEGVDTRLDNTGARIAVTFAISCLVVLTLLRQFATARCLFAMKICCTILS